MIRSNLFDVMRSAVGDVRVNQVSTLPLAIVKNDDGGEELCTSNTRIDCASNEQKATAALLVHCYRHLPETVDCLSRSISALSKGVNVDIVISDMAYTLLLAKRVRKI